MAGTTSFNLTGSTPNLTNTSTPMFGGTIGTPQSRALNNFQLAPKPVVAPPAPTGQQVTSHSVTHPDGTVVTQKYDTTSGMIGSGSTPPAQDARPGMGGYSAGNQPTDPTTQGRDAFGNLVNYNSPEQARLAASNLSAAQNYSPSYNPVPSGNSPYQQSVGGLINYGAGGNPYINNPYQGLLNSTPANAAIAQKAEGIADAAGRQITDIGEAGAKSEAGQRTTGTSPVGEGNAAVTAQTTAAQQQAVAQGAQTALKGTEQALTAQGQAQSGQIGAGNIATTAQGQSIGALGTAGGLANPQVTGYGQTSFNPYTNSFGTTGGGNGGSLNPLNNVQSIAQQVISGQISPSQAYNMGGNITNWSGVLNQELQNQQKGFDSARAQAAYDSKQSNATTVGTASTNAANTGYQGAVQEYQDNTAKYTALTGVSNQLTGTLANYANNGVLTDANAAINTIQGHLSNPDYQRFIAAMGNAQASYQSILGSSGVTPTKADQDAVNALNPNSSATAIVAALNQLSADAHSLIIVPSYQKVQNYKSQLGIH